MGVLKCRNGSARRSALADVQVCNAFLALISYERRVCCLSRQVIFRVYLAIWSRLGISYCYVLVERGSRRKRDQWFGSWIVECDERNRTAYVGWGMDVVNHYHHGLSRFGGSRKKAFISQPKGA